MQPWFLGPFLVKRTECHRGLANFVGEDNHPVLQARGVASVDLWVSCHRGFYEYHGQLIGNDAVNV